MHIPPPLNHIAHVAEKFMLIVNMTTTVLLYWEFSVNESF